MSEQNDGVAGITVRDTKRFLIQVAMIVGLFAVAQFAAATWSGPTATPPGGNVPAPLNVGTVNQVKSGGIGATSVVADRFCLGASCITSWPSGSSTTVNPQNNVGGTFKICNGTDGTSSGCVPSAGIPISCQYEHSGQEFPAANGGTYTGDFMRFNAATSRWQFWYAAGPNGFDIYYNCNKVLVFTPS